MILNITIELIKHIKEAQATFFMSIYKQVNSIKENVCCKGNAVIEHVVYLYNFNTSSTFSLSIIIIHLVMFVVIVLSIFFDKKSVIEPITKNST